MRLVELNQGKLELRYTWLPWWLAAGPALQSEIETLMRDVVVMNGMPPNDESLERIERFVIRLIGKRFPIPGLTTYLRGLQHVKES